MDKKELRKYMIEKRNCITVEEKVSLDKEILEKLRGSESYIDSKNIFIYIGFGSEINTKEYINEFLKDGKSVFIPRTVISSKKMEAVKVNSLENLEKNKYGILEPGLKEEASDKKILDLIILPGVAFDLYGGRLGYGGGYYDRFLIGTKAKKVALAYDFQIISKIEIEEHDIPADSIITEKRIIDF
ncbi:MAG: 5-formyltetrahydrofolate cyclo-ligase [Clostridiales bacterium]|nr:5-formyltetrahydrofolate cyclo-ligase [Clostridiales bacterium]